ncbi:MAG TPA: caspase family protein [Labilithrix sp.]|nr:caspase family protein [Labilithrix sp.]
MTFNSTVPQIIRERLVRAGYRVVSDATQPYDVAATYGYSNSFCDGWGDSADLNLNLESRGVVVDSVRFNAVHTNAETMAGTLVNQLVDSPRLATFANEHALGGSAPPISPPSDAIVGKAIVGLQFDQQQENRCVVTGVRRGYPAETAGFYAGDVVVRIGSNTVSDLRSCWTALLDQPVGVPSAWVVRRKDTELTVMVTPVARGTDSEIERAATVPLPEPPPPPKSGIRLAVAEPQLTAYALVVGIERYRDLPAPSGATADAKAFADVLRKTLGIPENNVRIALDDRATRTDLERHVAWLKGNARPGSRIYFFFSGHGAPDASNGTAFIVPYDGDAQAITQTSIALADLLRSLSEAKAKDVVAFVDTCFSGAGGRSVLPAGARPLSRVREVTGQANVALFSSSSGTEISGPAQDGKQGAFTKFLVEGFGAGRADADGDGQLTLRELADWVTPRVTREAKSQQRDQTPKLTVGPRFGEPKDYPLAWGLRP